MGVVRFKLARYPCNDRDHYDSGFSGIQINLQQKHVSQPTHAWISVRTLFGLHEMLFLNHDDMHWKSTLHGPGKIEMG